MIANYLVRKHQNLRGYSWEKRISALDVDECHSHHIKQESENTVNNACTYPQNASSHATKLQESVILHAILPVRVKGKGSIETVTTYAFYSNGSVGCFSNNSLAWTKKRQSYSRGRRLWVWVVGKNRSMVVNYKSRLIFMKYFNYLPTTFPTCTVS